MAKRKGSSTPSCSRARKKADRDAREAENARRLDKLPPEMWEKILYELDENDLFPLALSCRYFRQKQKELVARTRQSGPESEKPRLTLTTTLCWKPEKGQPSTAEYIKFCMEEKEFLDPECRYYLKFLAAYHGHLPLLQEPLADWRPIRAEVITSAGESSLSQSRLLVLSASDLFSSSQRAEANWRPCSG